MIPLVNLAKQNEAVRSRIEPLLHDIARSGEFVLGPHVAAFEEAFAGYCGGRFGVGVNSGTSALHVALLAAGVGPGDEVITTALTFTATVAAIGYTGARPVLVDIDPDTFTISPDAIAEAITPKTKAVVPVHLYGHPADMDPILELARRHGLFVIEDAAQAHGATYKGRRVGSLGDAGCFSFYPSKNLGAFGEAGMMVTNHPDWASRARSMRSWGGENAGMTGAPGFNYRMDAFQGAVLGIKLPHLDHWNRSRQDAADRYRAVASGGTLRLPVIRSWATHVFHIFAVRASDREAAMATFHSCGIETRVHYSTPIHLMKSFRALGYTAGTFPEAEEAAREVISIPVHPELDATDIATISNALKLVAHGTPILS